MKRNVTEHDFTEAFRDYGRNDEFSYEGLKALYEWFEEYEEGLKALEDTGEEIELDVIGICCDFSEYDSALEAAREYGNDWTPEMYDEDDEERNPEEIAEELETYCLEWLQDRTTVIVVDAVQYLGDRSFSGSVIIQGF